MRDTVDREGITDMAMSRRNYVATAEILRAALPNPSDHTADDCAGCQGERRAVENIAEGMADMFAADNGRFDRGRFLAACGVSE